MKIVFCRSNPVAPDPRVEKEARALADAGAEVYVVAWDRSGLFPLEERLDKFEVHRLRVRAGFSRGLRNLPALTKWQVRLLWWLVRNHDRFDIIHACDFDTLVPALLCKQVCMKKVVYDIFDFYADYLRSTPKLLKSLIRKIDIMAMGNVDAVIIADDSRRTQIAGASPKLLEVIYNSPEDISTKECTYLRPSFAFNIVYVGLLQVERGLFTLLQVLQNHPEWHLDIAGFGGDEDKILSYMDGMPNVTWHGRIPYEEALKLSSCADVIIATYDPTIPNHRYASPNKVFEAMMLGKPVVVAKDTNMDKLIEENNCGVVVSYGNANTLERALSDLSEDPAFRERLGMSGRVAYDTKFSWNIMRTRLLNLYQTVAQK